MNSQRFIVGGLLRIGAAILLLLTAVASRGANGDVLSATIETNGWVLDVAIQGMVTNGTYNFALGANNTLTGSEKVKLTVTCLGFDDQGNRTSLTRTIYGTFALRFPYPNQAFKDQTISAGVLTNKIVLSDYIFARDSNVVVQIQAGYYTAAGLNNNAGTLSVANGSLVAYPKPIANWTWPGWSRITGTNLQLRAVAFHQSAQQGRPVRLVRFIAQDAHGNAVTNDIATMTVDRSVGDQIPFGEYIANIPTASFVQGDLITCNFQAFPWIGDAARDTADGVNIQPTPLYAPQYFVNDSANAYGATVAVVAPGGSDTLGVAVDSARFNSGAPPAAFATISGAAAAIAATNRVLHARNDVGAGAVYLRSGNYTWLGASKSYGTVPSCYLEITTFPGDATASITNCVPGQNSLSGKVKLTKLNITAPSSGAFTGDTYFWMDQCTINSTSASLFYALPIWYVTRCNVVQLPQGLIPFSNINASPALIRGNLITGAQNGCFAYDFCGNMVDDTITGPYVFTDAQGRGVPTADGAIIYNNAFYRDSATSGRIFELYTDAMKNGLAFIQNIAECVTNGSQQFIAISGQSATNAPLNNVLFWHNDLVGHGCDLAYNNAGSNACQRILWSLKNNLFDKLNIKSDTGTSPTGNRNGDWSEVFGVAYSGNINANIVNVAPVGSFNLEYPGLDSVQISSGSVSNYFNFVNCQAFDGTSNHAGHGDYHLQKLSPAASLPADWILPYDFDGNARFGANVSGAYILSSPVGKPQNLHIVH